MDEDKTTFYSLADKKSTSANIQTPRRAYVCYWFGSFDAHAEQKWFELRWIGYSAKIQNPVTVKTANGEVQTTQEAQVYVHDLDLFVRVQLLDKTPAVLSLAKLCEEHGYSYEWITSRQPQLTKNVNKITCKTGNYVPLLVPGLSTSSDSSSSFTSKPHVPQLFLKDREQHHQIQWQIDVTNLQLGNHCWQTLTNLQLGNHLLDTKDRMATEDPTQGIPEWLQDFTANLEDLERHAPAHIPEGAHSDSEGSLKVVDNSKSRNTVFLLIFQRTEIAMYVCGLKLRFLHAEDTIKDLFREQKSLVTWKQQMTKSSTKEVNPGTITGTLSWYKILSLNGYNLIRVKPKLRKRHRKVYTSFLHRHRSQKLQKRKTHWKWANLVKN